MRRSADSIQFSQRSALEREPNAFARALVRARREGRTLLDLTISNPTAAAIPARTDTILHELSDPRGAGYEPTPFGLESARSALSADYRLRGISVPPERIVLTASTSEAYSLAFKLLCDPDDEILVPRPSYPLFEHLARFDSIRPVSYRLAYDGAWHVDLDSVRRAIGPRTRGIIAVSPNNPTGSYLKQGELESLAELELPIVCDEVFADYPLNAPADAVPSVLGFDAVLVIALGGLSKRAALPQLKLAWAALGGSEPVVAEALARLELIADAYLSVATPVQVALPRLLSRTESVRDAIAARAKANLAALRAALDGSSATLLPTEGGWYAIIRFPKTASEESWIVELLEVEGVIVQPGWLYDFEDEPFGVVSLLTPELDLADGAARLARFVAR
jgi:alanine-synthesizing transaminase